MNALKLEPAQDNTVSCFVSSLILQLSINTNGKKNPGLGEIFYQEEKKKKMRTSGAGDREKESERSRKKRQTWRAGIQEAVWSL